MKTIYPPTTFSLTNTVPAQVQHVFSEIREVDHAVAGVDLTCESALILHLDLFEELADLQHSIETGLGVVVNEVI